MTVKIVKMDIANYVNKVGNLINQSTKYNVKLDRISITNVVLLSHMEKVINWMKDRVGEEITEEDIQKGYFVITQKHIDKISRYLNCLKKEINFYPDKDIDEDCILTETEDHIIQE